MPEPQRAPRRIVIVDTEFTNLDPAAGDVVEIAYAFEDGPVISGVPPHTLTGHDPESLEINRYRERDLGDKSRWNHDIIENATRALSGQVLAGMNPRIDARMLEKRIGYEPWHYRLAALESAAWLLLGFTEPPSLRQLRDLLAGLGYELPEPDHTAAGDVEVERACLKIMQRIARLFLAGGIPGPDELTAFESIGAQCGLAAAAE